MWKTEIETPVGKLLAFANSNGMTALSWPGSKNAVQFSAQDCYEENEQLPLFDSLACQLSEYFDRRRREFDLPLDPKGTDFQQRAWNALLEIPYGETRSYAQQAKTIGNKNAVRAIGAANGKNPISILVPCHRVVGSDGSLTGFAGGIEIKRYLLALESKTILV